MPTAKAIPASEMTLMERPMAAMATNAPTTETGMKEPEVRAWISIGANLGEPKTQVLEAIDCIDQNFMVGSTYTL